MDLFVQPAGFFYATNLLRKSSKQPNPSFYRAFTHTGDNEWTPEFDISEAY